MTIKRYIAGLLLICFSAFLGHNLVPHHHHSEVFHSPIATDCPFEHGDHQGHDHDMMQIQTRKSIPSIVMPLMMWYFRNIMPL